MYIIRISSVSIPVSRLVCVVCVSVVCVCMCATSTLDMKYLQLYKITKQGLLLALQTKLNTDRD
jgi:hypothetical protein